MLKSDVQPSVLGLDTTRIAKLVNILENSTTCIYPLLTNILILGYFGLKKSIAKFLWDIQTHIKD